MAAPYFDSETGFAYPAPEGTPFQYTPTQADLEASLAPMILSASGWRKVFALSANENDPAPDVAPADQVLCWGMADVFGQFVRTESGKERPRIAMGMDSRPTGPILADGMLRVLVAQGFEIDLLGIVAAPQIMAWVQSAQIHDGFIYISASHNPVGHNGMKFGLADGGVVGGAKSARLIAGFRDVATDPNAAQRWVRDRNRTATNDVSKVLDAMSPCRKASERHYTRLSDTILTLSDFEEDQTKRKEEIRRLVQTTPVGVIAEMNGSARGLSIDRRWLEGLGLEVKSLNDKPRSFAHAIIPEGPSLDLCRRELEGAAQWQPHFQLGYVPDCDGDRGNIVFRDPRTGVTRSLEAQEGFALCVLSELAGLDYYQATTGPVAVVCNDPTSFRIEEISQAWGAQVFRAEVGEANVVSLARQLRDQGWTVRILGEGSNGGNITYPGSVRDPLSTLGSLIKLLTLRSTPVSPGLFERWCERSGQREAYRPDYTLADVVATLPLWTTTETSDPRAILQIRSRDQGILKQRFETLWPEAWIDARQRFAHLGWESWEQINYEGTLAKPGVGPQFRTGKQTGGLKLVMKNAKGTPVGCLWMRGSGTEPVFRVLADLKGQRAEDEKSVLAWFTAWLRRAD